MYTEAACDGEPLSSSAPPRPPIDVRTCLHPLKSQHSSLGCAAQSSQDPLGQYSTRASLVVVILNPEPPHPLSEPRVPREASACSRGELQPCWLQGST